MDIKEASVANTQGAAETKQKHQVLPDEILWLAGKHYLQDLQDIFSLAISSQALWRIMSVELYTTAIDLSKEFETIEDVRKFVPHTTSLPPLGTCSDDLILLYAEEIMRIHGSAQTILPGEIPETPWRDFFSRNRMSRQSPLHHAAAHGHTTVATRLLQAAKSTWPEIIDAKDPSGHMAIHLASQSGHFDVVKLLVDAGSSKRHPSGYFYWVEIGVTDTVHRWCAFLEVSTHELASIVNDIVPGTMKPVRGRFNLYIPSPRFAIDALGLAIANGHQKLAHYLMEFYDEDFSYEWHLVPPVHLASVFGQYSILEELLTGGANVNLPSRHFHGATPAHMAAVTHKGVGVLKLLKSHGAGLDAWDDCDRTPLQWAAESGSGDNMMCLVELGAKVDEEVLRICFQREGWRSYAEKILETLERLPEALWCGPDTLRSCTQNLMRQYSPDRDEETMEYIIKNRIGLGPRDPRNNPDSECFDWEGTSSLHVAAESPKFPENMLKLLLEQKAVNVNLRNVWGLTALDMALGANEQGKARLVREHGGVTAQQLMQEFLESQTTPIQPKASSQIAQQKSPRRTEKGNGDEWQNEN